MLKYVIVAILAAGGAFGVAISTLAPKQNQESSREVPTLPEKVENTKTVSVKVTTLSPSYDQLVFLKGGISERSVQYTLMKLESARKSGITEVFLVIDSPGGLVIAGSELVSYIRNSKMTINTVCSGMCASMGAQIHQAGKKRYMYEKALLMFHPASGGVQGTLEQMTSQLVVIQRYVDRLDVEVAARSKLSYEEFKSKLASEFWLEGIDAIQYGFADGLVLLLAEDDLIVEASSVSDKKTSGSSVDNLRGIK